MDSILYFCPKYGQGGRGSKNSKILRASYVRAPLSNAPSQFAPQSVRSVQLAPRLSKPDDRTINMEWIQNGSD